MGVLRFLINRLMAVWLIACALIAYFFPQPFLFLRNWTLWLLAAVIFLMGLTLKWEEIGRVFARPRGLLTGIISKWLIVPLFAYLAATIAFPTQPQLAVGVILDGATPSGVSANVFTFLSGGAVALSIAMCAINTLISPVLTPFATSTLAGRFVPVDARAIFLQMLQVVLAPVLLGLVVRTLFRRQVEKAQEVLPLLSALALFLIVLALISASAVAIRQQLDLLPKVILVTCLQIVVTLALGCAVGVLSKLPRKDSLAIMFEVGIYNSGLGATLAARNFGPFAALPALANAIANLVIGSLVTAYLVYRMSQRPQEAAEGTLAEIDAAGAR